MARGMEARTNSLSSSSHTARSATEVLEDHPDNSATGTSMGAKRVSTEVNHCISLTEAKDNIEKKSFPVNYFGVKTAPGWTFYEYHVDFEPKPDKTLVMKKLFKQAVDTNVGYIFDGSVAYTPKLFGENADQPGDRVDLNEEAVDNDGTSYKISVKLMKKLDRRSPAYVDIYNVFLRKCILAVESKLLGSNFFDPQATIEIPSLRLILCPTYATYIQPLKTQMLLCVETTHQVIHLDSVLHVIKGLERSNGSNMVSFKEAVKKELSHSIVMTMYNMETYAIDKVDFGRSPKSIFDISGKMQSLVEYYKTKYNIDIKDLDQPLLTVKPGANDMHWELSGDIFLVPELCNSIGLTDTMRANISLMKELCKYYHQGPQHKIMLLDRILKRMRENETIKKELAKWGMEFDGELTLLQGRTEGNQIMVSKNDTLTADNKGDLEKVTLTKVLSSIKSPPWAILAYQRDFAEPANMVLPIPKVVDPLSMKINRPKQIGMVPDEKSLTYLKAMDEVLQNQSLQTLVLIFPDNIAGMYNSVINRLDAEPGLLSEFFLAVNVTSKEVMSIANDVAVKTNVKLSRKLRTLNQALKNTMIVGFDVYHTAKGRRGVRVGAMVATYSGNYAKFYSATSILKRVDDGEKLSANLLVELFKCRHSYCELNREGGLPERIIVYRYGVGEGKLKQVYDVELKTLSEALAKLYQEDRRSPPKLTYIVVTKRPGTKLLAMTTDLQNPPPGTVFDDVVTLAERHDFYLISCAARQGTVSPSSYDVLRDDSNFDAGKLQLITTNKSRICHFAHKLAYLTDICYVGHANLLSQFLDFLQTSWSLIAELLFLSAVIFIILVTFVISFI